MLAAVLVASITPALPKSSGQGTPVPASSPFVVSFSIIKADAAAQIIQTLYPGIRITVDHGANALVITAPPAATASIREIATGIDTKNPLALQVQALPLHTLRAGDAVSRLSPLFRGARFSVVNDHVVIVSATNAEIQQIQTLIGAIDAPPTMPTPAPAPTPPATEAVRILSASPKDVAREVAGAVHGLRVSVAQQNLVLAGTPDVIQRAKDVIAVLDAPPPGTPYTAVYRIKTLDAKSVADLLQRSFPEAKVAVDEDINSLSVYATAVVQNRIATGIAQLDTAGPFAAGSAGAPAAVVGTGPAEAYTLKYALPSQNGGPSTSATDLATMVTQTLSSQAPDLHIVASINSPQLYLTGSPYSIKLARDLLQKMDVPQQLVVLDTEILEMDENTAKNLGIEFQNAVGGPFSIGTIFSEVAPTPDPVTGVTPPVKRLLTLTRTPLAFGAVLNLAIAHGEARVLADPRITTLSGHTATIRAGDNISIQLQAGGGPGTIATTQIQTFQTGVTLDITPIVNDNNLITVALHPVVNSLTGILNGIPQISTRDTQTTVALQENETLVIGGLIQDNTQRTESKLPVLGDIPVVGRLFRNETLNGNRNELIISVTPHIIVPGETHSYPGPPLPAIPTPAALPTLPPGSVLPAQAPTPMAALNSVAGPLRSMEPPPSTLVTTPKATAARPVSTPTTPIPSAAGLATLPAPTSSSMPLAFAQANTFTFGAPPQNNYASSGDATRIYYVTVSPTTLTYGAPLNIVAITSTNVTQLSLSYGGVSLSVPQVGPGQWQGSVPFTLVGQPVSNNSISLTLIASKNDGTQAMIPVSVTVLPH